VGRGGGNLQLPSLGEWKRKKVLFYILIKDRTGFEEEFTLHKEREGLPFLHQGGGKVTTRRGE